MVGSILAMAAGAGMMAYALNNKSTKRNYDRDSRKNTKKNKGF